MLRRIGFRYAERIDPFDGGPHFVAPVDEVSLVQNTRKLPVIALLDASETSGARALVARDLAQAPYFKAVACRVKLEQGGVRVPAASAAQLGVGVGDTVCVLPLP